ncbi:hypothetical protein So717_26740 [Roseobacter cerasinus]|uniref:Uncharacterized protein n=1 Tax=Roseobacter cerasinus TaxID=2602289 RepID=A0A640VV12_9RHOB|nr:hypothetical protein [Roseobacter cerasinus]GFE50921.1 hypothetical protein So717_26740 [Roseobacter cerasinus]
MTDIMRDCPNSPDPELIEGTQDWPRRKRPAQDGRDGPTWRNPAPWRLAIRIGERIAAAAFAPLGLPAGGDTLGRSAVALSETAIQ